VNAIDASQIAIDSGSLRSDVTMPIIFTFKEACSCDDHNVRLTDSITADTQVVVYSFAKPQCARMTALACLFDWELSLTNANGSALNSTVFTLDKAKWTLTVHADKMSHLSEAVHELAFTMTDKAAEHLTADVKGTLSVLETKSRPSIVFAPTDQPAKDVAQ